VADGAIRAIVLDYNGTLAQDNHLVAPLYVQGFAAAGTELTVEEYHREFAATPDHLAFSEAIRRSGRPVEAAERDALVEHVLGVAGIDAHFDTVVAIDHVRHGKPHPEGFTRALDQINALATPEAPIAAHEVVAVEDATEGAEAARAAGMHVAAIRGLGYDPASQLAEMIIERLDVAALEQMLALGRKGRSANER
jgi:beta-phosphoglucomutase-like phosphatase (HAD superfamily)